MAHDGMEDTEQRRRRRQRERVTKYRAANKDRVAAMRANIYRATHPDAGKPKPRKYPEDERLPGEDDVAYRLRLQRNHSRRHHERHKDEMAQRARDKRAAQRPIDAPGRGRKKGSRNLNYKHADDAQRNGESDADWKARRQRNGVYRYRAANKAAVDARRREIYAERGRGDAVLAWRKANKAKIKAWFREYDLRNREQKIAALKAWGAANPERFKAAQKAWRDAHPEVFVASSARVRAKIIQRVPAWADWKKIDAFYALAKRLTRQTGVVHQVDHIIPLNGKHVSGLHVHTNLQVLTAEANRAKRNHYAEAE